MRLKIVLALVLAALALPAFATPWPQSDIPADPAVTFGVLSNGMRYAIMHNNTPTGAVSLRLRIATGSIQESPEQRGLAHFVEHMAFRGSAHVPDGAIEKTLSQMGLSFGADINASTDQDETIYQFDLPQSSGPILGTAMGYLREIASNLTLDPAAAKTEAGVVLSELRLRDGPGYRALQKRLDLLLVDPHATALASGDPAIIAQAPVEQLRAYYHAFYRPERATLVVVGDIDPAEIERRIKTLFGDWAVTGPAGADPVLSVPLRRGLEAGIYAETGAPTNLSLAWMGPPEKKPQDKAVEKSDLIDYVALRILNRRFQDAAAGADHPFNGAGASHDDNLHAVGITDVSINYGDKDWRGALAAAEAIRLEMLRDGVTQDEVDRAVTELHASFAASAAGAGTRPSSRLAVGILREVSEDDVYTSPVRDLATLDEDFAGLKAETVSAHFRALFTGGGPVMFLSARVPEPGAESALKAAYLAAEQAAPVPRVAQASSGIKAWSHADFGRPGRVVETRQVADLGVTYMRFANGVRLTLRPSKLRANQVLVSVKVGGGRLDLPRDRATAAWAAPGALIRGGLSDMSYTQMQRLLVGKLYSANFSIGEDGFVLSGGTVPSDIDTQLQVLAAYLTQPGFRPEGFQQTQAQLGSQLRQIDSNPSAVFGARAPQFLHENDMRWKFPTLEEVQDAKVDDVRSLLAPAFAHGAIDVTITGDITPEAAVKAVAATFGALPPRDAARPTVTRENATHLPAGGAAIALAHSGSPGQDIASLLWPTLGRFPDIKDDVAQSLTADIMQERLFDKLRGEGLTYVAQVGGSSSKVFDYGYIQAMAQMPRDKTAAFDEAVSAIIADIKAGHIAPEELERARVPALQNLQKARQTNEYWLTALDDTAEHPEKLVLIRDYEADLKQITVADIAATARKYLVADKVIKVRVGL